MPDFHDNVALNAPTPAVDLRETDQALPAGLWRMRLEGNSWSLVRNTAVAGDYSTSQVPLSIDATGAATFSETLTMGNASANYLQAIGAASGFAPVLARRGAGTNKGMGFDIDGVGAFTFTSQTFGHVDFQISSIAGAVNFLGVAPNVAGAAPSLFTAGASTDISIALFPKGAGNVSINNTGASGLLLNGAAGNRRSVQFLSGGTGGANLRWLIGADAGPEVGANAGSNCEILRLSDTGVALGTPLSISRASGTVTLEQAPILSALTGYVKANGATASSASATIPTADVTPPGATTQVLFNNAGAWAGDAGLTWDTAGKTLTLGGTDTEIIVKSRTAAPAAPVAGNLAVYARPFAGREFLETEDPNGITRIMQGALWGRRIEWTAPGNAAALTNFGVAVTTQGTISHPALATTNRKTATRRATLTSTTTAGTLASFIAAAATWYRGIGAGIGGYFAQYIFTLETLQAGNRGFFGMQDSVAALTNINPLTNTTPGRVGIGFAANTGNWQLINNVTGTAPTVVDLGASFPINTTDVLSLTLAAAPNASSIQYVVRNLTSGAEASGSLSSNIPAATTFLASVGWMTNNATAASVAWSLFSSFVEDVI